MKNPPVKDIMTRDPISIAPDLGVDVALELMGAHGCRRLPVVSATGRVIGIITLATASRAVPGKMLDETGATRPDLPRVRDVMTDYVYTLDPDEPVGSAARRMVNHKIGAMPVVEDGKLVGILTESDIFRFVAAQFEPAAAA